jgi:putative DNA primase/helicase
VSPSKIYVQNIPAELTALPNWVLWRFETRGGKQTKVPYHPSDVRARSDDPRMWTSLEQCVAVLDRFDGVGFQFVTRELMRFSFRGGAA